MAILKYALIAFYCLSFTHARNLPTAPNFEESREYVSPNPTKVDEVVFANDMKVGSSSPIGSSEFVSPPRKSIEVDWTKGVKVGPSSGIGSGYGSGSGTGSGTGTGTGYGSGSGSGNSGSGYGYGSGSGGSGTGVGMGYGYGSGSGSGPGYGTGTGTGIGIGVGQGSGNSGYPFWGCSGCPTIHVPPCNPSWPNDPNCGFPQPCIPPPFYPGQPRYSSAIDLAEQNHQPTTEADETRGHVTGKTPNNETTDPSTDGQMMDKEAQVRSAQDHNPQVQT